MDLRGLRISNQAQLRGSALAFGQFRVQLEIFPDSAFFLFFLLHLDPHHGHLPPSSIQSLALVNNEGRSTIQKPNAEAAASWRPDPQCVI